MTTVYNVPLLRDYFTARLQVGNPAVTELLQAVAGLVRIDPCCARLQSYANALQKDDEAFDVNTQLALATRLLGDDGVLTYVAPAMASVYLEQEGRGHLDEVFLEEIPVTPRFDRQHIATALSQNDPRTTRPPASVDVLAAVDRQTRDWGRLVGGTMTPMGMGALATGGDFDTAMMLLAEQAYAHQARHGSAKDERPLFISLMTRPGSDVDALRFTAAISKRKLPLGELPCGTTAFPIEICGERDVRKQFELLFWTPRGSEMETGFDGTMAGVLPKGAFVVYDPKTFSHQGLDMDEHAARVLAEAVRSDVTTAFIAGYTGASDVFGLKLLYQDSLKVRGINIGAGVTNLERGRQWAAQMTCTPVESGRREIIGGAEVYVYQNASLKRPLIIWVYSDPDLRKSQRLFAIYKNIYSGIIGQRLFAEVWRLLLAADGEIRANDIEDVKIFYQGLVGQYQKEIVDLLVNVEEIPRDKAIILEPSQQDAVGSWGVREGGIGKLFHLVRALLFEPYSNGSVDPGVVSSVVQRFQSEIDQVFSTRNPRAGACLAAGYEALRYRLVDGPFDLMPPGVTFEGLNTALQLDRRLDADKMARLPQPVKDYLVAAKAVRNPLAIPPDVRKGLTNLAGLLAKIASGQTPSPREVKALWHRPVNKKRDIRDTMRWKDVRVEMVVEVALSLKIHLETAIRTIDAYGAQHARLATPLVNQLRAMIWNMELLAELVRERNQRKSMSSQELLGVLHGIKSLITEGDRLYLVGEVMEDVMRDLKARMDVLHAYLLGIHEVPYPQGRRVFLNRRQREALHEALVARSSHSQVANG